MSSFSFCQWTESEVSTFWIFRILFEINWMSTQQMSRNSSNIFEKLSSDMRKQWARAHGMGLFEALRERFNGLPWPPMILSKLSYRLAFCEYWSKLCKVFADWRFRYIVVNHDRPNPVPIGSSQSLLLSRGYLSAQTLLRKNRKMAG
jgi:hypothetical protein